MTTVSVIGAGPAGAYAGQLLAKAGYDVTIYEEHAAVGKPVACTGIVTKVLWELVRKKKEFMVNELDAVRIVAPNNNHVDIPLHEYVIDRAAFDNCLAAQAINAGAALQTLHRFIDAKNGAITFKHKGETITKKTDIVIGADGPTSNVAKSAGIYGSREFWIGLQVTVKKKWNPNIFLTYFGGICPGFFAWAVPENSQIARVGLAAQQQAKAHFDRFLLKLGGKILEQQPGPIPKFTGRELVEKDNVFLVGDAGGLVKATTGGGIITGILSSKILSECLQTGASYSKALWQLKKELHIHRLIRKTLNNFSEQDYNMLIDYMNTPGVKKILKENPREYPSRFLLKLLLKQPKFIRFAPRILW
ncbi:MAG: geranylgeranyl reductase family protein [Candidatus Aenigmarchaeota archaeon]|nr:geranylgeranyl reductase family protein [Candidatus Aenigmarchaeota archaeon]